MLFKYDSTILDTLKSFADSEQATEYVQKTFKVDPEFKIKYEECSDINFNFNFIIPDDKMYILEDIDKALEEYTNEYKMNVKCPGCPECSNSDSESSESSDFESDSEPEYFESIEFLESLSSVKFVDIANANKNDNDSNKGNISEDEIEVFLNILNTVRENLMTKNFDLTSLTEAMFDLTRFMVRNSVNHNDLILDLSIPENKELFKLTEDIIEYAIQTENNKIINIIDEYLLFVFLDKSNVEYLYNSKYTIWCENIYSYLNMLYYEPRYKKNIDPRFYENKDILFFIYNWSFLKHIPAEKFTIKNEIFVNDDIKVKFSDKNILKYLYSIDPLLTLKHIVANNCFDNKYINDIIFESHNDS